MRYNSLHKVCSAWSSPRVAIALAEAQAQRRRGLNPDASGVRTCLPEGRSARQACSCFSEVQFTNICSKYSIIDK